MSDGLKLLAHIAETGSSQLLRDLPRHYFVRDELPAYDFIRAHLRRHGDVPVVATVEEELGLALPQVPEAYEYYFKKVLDRHLYTLLRPQYHRLTAAMRANSMDEIESIVNEMRLATRRTHSATDIRTFGEVAIAVMEQYEEAHENPGISGVAVGWPHFDTMVGGYQSGDLVTWVGRPELGKTYVMLRQAVGSWGLGHHVLIVSMELSLEQMGRRLAGLTTGINPRYIRNGCLSTYAKRRMEEYLDTIARDRRLTMLSGGFHKKVSDLEIVVQEYMPDIVYIDGVYLMASDNTRLVSKVDKVSDVLDSLKRLTLTLHRPIVATTQFNRTAGKKGKEGSLENIAYSDAISTHSSLVIGLQEGEAPYQTVRRKAVFLKGREGESGTFHFHYRFSPTDMSEVSLSEVAAELRGEPLPEGVDLDLVA